MSHRVENLASPGTELNQVSSKEYETCPFLRIELSLLVIGLFCLILKKMFLTATISCP